jgi:hypothetical protein
MPINSACAILITEKEAVEDYNSKAAFFFVILRLPCNLWSAPKGNRFGGDEGESSLLKHDISSNG